MRVESHVLDSGSGRPVVLLHAFPLSASMWLHQRESLAGAGFRALTPDQRGFGGSPLGEDEPSLDEVADDVAAMLDARRVDGPVVVGGLSMGGYVAMAFLRRHRERVAALVLADTKAGADPPDAVANRERIAAEVAEAGSAKRLAEDLLPKLVGKTTLTSRALVLGRVRALAEAAPPAAVAWAQRAMAARPDSFETLRAVDVPTLVVVGEEDELSPVGDAEAMAAAIPGARLVVLPEAGHLSAVETPEAFDAALLEFVRDL